jgi:hypothetical protein
VLIEAGNWKWVNCDVEFVHKEAFIFAEDVWQISQSQIANPSFHDAVAIASCFGPERKPIADASE